MASQNPILQYLIQGYRAGETLPVSFERAAILDMANGIRIALDQGMPVEGKDLYVKKVLLEGRWDAGTNEFNYNNPRANALYKKTMAAGASPRAATYAAAVLDKLEVSKRLNIPFELAWNGTGRVVDKKGVAVADGQRHAERAKLFENVTKDPRNADLVETVNRVASSGPTDQEAMLMRGADKIVEDLAGSLGWYGRRTSKLRDIMEDKIYRNLPKEERMRVSESIDVNDLGTYRMQMENIRFDKPKYLSNNVRFRPPTELPTDPATRSVIEAMTGVDNSFATYKASKSMRYPPAPSTLDTITNYLSSLLK
jgi:hypothetical protein